MGRVRVDPRIPKGYPGQSLEDDDNGEIPSAAEEHDQTGHADAETMPFNLPSQLGHDWCNRNAAEDLAKAEIHLREGQLNDSLHHIRIALGHKSYLFQNDVCPARTLRLKTRAWAGVHMVESTVQHHTCVYTRARQAMVDLGAAVNILDWYKVLTRWYTQYPADPWNPGFYGFLTLSTSLRIPGLAVLRRTLAHFRTLRTIPTMSAHFYALPHAQYIPHTPPHTLDCLQAYLRIWHIYSHWAFPCLSPPCSAAFPHIPGHFPALPTCLGHVPALYLLSPWYLPCIWYHFLYISYPSPLFLDPLASI